MTRWIGLFFSALATLSCERQVRLVVPDTSDSQSYICPLAKGGETPRDCERATVDIPRTGTESGTTFFVAPPSRPSRSRSPAIGVRSTG